MQFKKLVAGRRGPIIIGTAVLAVVMGGGGAVAAGLVTSRQIADHSIRNVDLGIASVGSNSIRNGSVRRGDLRFEVQDGTDGAKGEAGATGAAGPAGPKGETGAVGPAGAKGAAGVKGDTGDAGQNGVDGAVGYDIATAEETVAGSGNTTLATYCADGKVAVGGGVRLNAVDGELPDDRLVMQASYPFTDGSAWNVVTATNNQDGSSVTTYAVCVDAPPVG